MVKKQNCVTWIQIASYIKTDDIYKDIAEDVETRFDNSNYKLQRPLPKKKEKENIGVMKDKLSEKIMREFVGLKQNDC